MTTDATNSPLQELATKVRTHHEAATTDLDRRADNRLRQLLADRPGRHALGRLLRRLAYFERAPADRLDRYLGKRDAALMLVDDLRRVDGDKAELLLAEERGEG